MVKLLLYRDVIFPKGLEKPTDDEIDIEEHIDEKTEIIEFKRI